MASTQEDQDAPDTQTQSGPGATVMTELLEHHSDERFELLILSEAGKPIYSFTKRDDAVTLMPLCSALIDYAKRTQKEPLQSIKTSDNLSIVFHIRSPLIIIVIHETYSYADDLVLVDQVEAQLISILTAKSLKSVFDDRPTFDLKRLLYGSEKLIDATINLSAFPTKLQWPHVGAFLAVTASSCNLSNSTNLIGSSNNPALSSNSSGPPIRPHRVLVPIVSMPQNTRENLNSSINNIVTNYSKNIVFSLLFRMGPDEIEYGDTNSELRQPNFNSSEETNDSSAIRFRLVTVCNHLERHKMKISDIHIILALLTGSRTQLRTVESLWMPVCLPKFNQDAFLHAYIAYMNNNNYCIVMMSINRDEFSNCQKSRNSIEERLASILDDSNQKDKIYYQLSPLVHPVLLQLQDKLSSNSLTSDELAEFQQKAKIYNSKMELYHARQLQFLWYQTNKQVLCWQRSHRKGPNMIIYHITKKMLQSSLKHLWMKLADDTIFLGWHVPTFQLYAQFDCSITTNEATEVVQRITNWIKKEEDNFSIKDYRR